MGFYGENSYWADSWNRLDFFIVMVSFFDFVPGIQGGSLKTVRVARVLRPLRAINKLPNLRILIRMIIKTMPMLGSVASLVLFIFVVFAILGERTTSLGALFVYPLLGGNLTHGSLRCPTVPRSVEEKMLHLSNWWLILDIGAEWRRRPLHLQLNGR